MELMSEPEASVDEAFAEFYRSEQPGAIRLAWLLSHERDICDDLVQDAFTAVYRRFATLEKPAAYLRITLVNGVANGLGRASVKAVACASSTPAVPRRSTDQPEDSPMRSPDCRSPNERPSCCAIGPRSPTSRSPRSSASVPPPSGRSSTVAPSNYARRSPNEPREPGR